MISYEELSKVFDMENPLTLEYFELVDRHTEEPRYFHRHHILPKSMFPEYRTSQWNIVKLNYKQHVKAHEILSSICAIEKHKHKMVNAYFMLLKVVGCTAEDQQVYAELKRLQRESKLGQNNPMYGKSPSAETRAKASKANKGRKKPDTMRKRLSIAKTGTKMSRDSVERSAAKHRGKKASEELKRKLSIAQTGRKHSEETKKKQAAWHTGRSRPKEVVDKFTETKRRIFEKKFTDFLTTIGITLISDYVSMKTESTFRCDTCGSIFVDIPTKLKYTKNYRHCEESQNDKPTTD